MKRKILSGTMLKLLLIGMLTLAFNIQPVKSGTNLTGDVEVGALLPMTGDLATYGENAWSAVTLAEEEVNDFLQATDAGWTLKLVREDSATSATVSLEKAESLHARGIKFMIGPQASDGVSGIKDYCDANEILVVSPSSTRPGLNKPDDFLFRFCPTDLIQGPAIARLMIDDNITKVIAVYRNDAWGKGLNDATKARFEALGGTFIDSIGYDPAAPGFATIAETLNTEVTSAIAMYGADKVGVLYIAFEEVVEFFTECSARSSTGWGVKWYGSDGTTMSADMIADTTVAEFSYRTRFINPIFSPTRSDRWQRVHDHVYATLGRSPDAYTYAAYDIVWVLALSLLEIDAYDSEAVRVALPTIAQNYFGASGWIMLDENGDRASADYDLWIIDRVGTTYEWKYVGKYIQATDSIIWGPPPPVYVFETVWNGKIFYVVTESNSTVSDYYFNPVEGPFIVFNVTGSDGTIGFCRVAIPKQLLWVKDGNWTVLVDGDPVNATVIKEDDYYTHLYFTYSHSTKTVQIIGTHVMLARPIATFTYSPAAPLVGETVTFDASASYDPDGTIVSYAWDFDDGTTGTGMIVTHAYTATGTYTVTLTVTDNDTLTSTSIETVTVIVSIPIGGQLFAGGSDPGVVYKYDGASWEVISPILGKAVLSLIEYDGQLYAGVTSSVSVGQVYRYDGVAWTLVGDNMDEQVASLVVWNGELYAGTVHGAKRLLRYNVATNTWTEVLTDALPSGIRVMYVWENDNALYLGDFNSDTIGRYDGTTYEIVASFGRSCIWDFQSYNGYLYASAYLGLIYRSSNGFDWTVTITNPESRNIWALEEYQGYLYQGMDWTSSGNATAQLWRYDGVSQELVWTTPVSGSHQGIISMATDGNLLFMGLGGEEGYYGTNGTGQVYGYDGLQAQLISGVMGEGIQVLYFSGPFVRPEHDISVSMQAPSHMLPQTSTIINVTVSNIGLNNETNVEVQFYVDGLLQNSTIIPFIENSSRTSLEFPWFAPAVEGSYNLTAYVVPVSGENRTVNNVAKKLVVVSYPLIHPVEGQYANYLMTSYNETGPLPEWMRLNLTYVQYVTPYIINVTMWQQDSYGETYTQWMLVNTITRQMTGYGGGGGYYFGWIETNITVGSTVRLLDTYGVVKGSQIIEAAGTYIDCWIVEMMLQEYNYTWWYDKATGLWVGMRYSDPYNPGYYSLYWLVNTNVPIGGALRIETDKTMYTRLELATITATYIMGNTPIENATVTLQVNYPNGTLYFIWTATTDANGIVTHSFFIEKNAPYGVYTVFATAYKPGLDPRTATTTFVVGHLEPNIEMWFEGPDVALIGYNTTIMLHIYNTGNATAYNVSTTLTIPSNLIIISASTTYNGAIDPGLEVTLVAIVAASSPSRHVFTASTAYTKVDGTPMPTVYAEKTLVYAYHEDYPVDLTEMTVTATAEQIIINLTITNYGESPVQITVIASAQHLISKLMLRSVYQTLIINSNETITVSLVITIPSTAPSGDYIVQGILATELPSQDGFTLARRQEIVVV